MRTPKLKAQPTNAFFATVNQIFGGSYNLPTAVERAAGNEIVEHSSSDNETVVEPPIEFFLMVEKSAFVGWALNYFRVRMLLRAQ